MGVKICYTKDTEREVDSNVQVSTLKDFKARKVIAAVKRRLRNKRIVRALKLSKSFI